MKENKVASVLVLSFKTSKLNQTVFNQRKLKSTSINLQERISQTMTVQSPKQRSLNKIS